MNITKTVERIHGKEVTKFFVDGIHVATCKKYQEWFCTIGKGGNPSTIRNKMKTAKETVWHSVGLIQLLGDNVRQQIGSGSFYDKKVTFFMDIHPDTTWGYSGSILSANTIKEKINAFRNLASTGNV